LTTANTQKQKKFKTEKYKKLKLKLHQQSTAWTVWTVHFNVAKCSNL